jgi:hypothetical protein
MVEEISESSPLFLQSSSSEEDGSATWTTNEPVCKQRPSEHVATSWAATEYAVSRFSKDSRSEKEAQDARLAKLVRSSKRRKKISLVALKHLGPKIQLLAWMAWRHFQEEC